MTICPPRASAQPGSVTRLPNIALVEADAVGLALRDPELRQRAHVPAMEAASAIVRAVTVAQPPLQHAIPVLALGRAVAGLALLFGDPAFIDAVADAARAALADGSVTIEDLFRRDPQQRSAHP